MLNELECVDIVIPDCPFGGISKEFIDKHKITKVYMQEMIMHGQIIIKY